MRSIQASAPGKLFFSGEYAVLERAPALLSAVDTRAVCRIEPIAGNVCFLSTPPLASSPAAFQLADGMPRWHGEGVPLVDAAWGALDGKRREQLASSAWEMSLDTSAFFRKGRKLGLGSSAAALAALMGAFWEASGGLPENGEALASMQRAHSAWQGGGSGADLAVALAGGTVLFRREPHVVAPVSLPEHLAVLPVWTGQPASTARFLRQLHAWRESSPGGYAECMRLLSQKAEEMAQVTSDGDLAAFLFGMKAYGDALHTLGKLAGMDIWTEAHRRIARLVELGGAVYKPSGAGGGDLGLVVMDARDATVVEGVKSVLSSNGFEVLPLRFGARGLHIASTANE